MWCMAACCVVVPKLFYLLGVTPLVHQPTLRGCQAGSCLLAGHWQLGAAPLLLARLHYPAWTALSLHGALCVAAWAPTMSGVGLRSGNSRFGALAHQLAMWQGPMGGEQQWSLHSPPSPCCTFATTKSTAAAWGLACMVSNSGAY